MDDNDKTKQKSQQALKKKLDTYIHQDRIVPIHSADKRFHESWHKGRNLLNLPAPTRIICAGPL